MTFNLRYSSVLIVLFIIGYSLAGNTSLVLAEVYVRQVKNGVIYYYFSAQCEKQKIVSSTYLARPRTIRQNSLPSPSPENLSQLIQKASHSHNLPPALIKAMIKVESNFNPGATSPKGAQGLMQLIPETAELMGVSDSFNVAENIQGGTRYLWLLLQKFNHRLPLALAAYNAGPQRVEKRQAVPPIEETQQFVRNVCIEFLRYSQER